MNDPEEAGIYQIENHQLVQGQVIGSGNIVHQYFGPLNAASAGHAASFLPDDIWNIPFARNPFFTGREDLLERLHTQLQTTQTAALSQPQAISGLGGIGKTQLAIEYAYRYSQEYQVVLWARAETTEALNTSYTEIARVLHLPQQEAQEQEVVVQAVKDWLRSKSGWLLLLDNADDLNLVQTFLPPRYTGHLLLTTRAQIMGKFARRLEVDTLDRQMGALLLLRRAGLLPPDALLSVASAGNQTLALTLTEELGGLPLALDQAGAYIEETQCSLTDYQHQHQTRRAELLAHRGMLVDDHPEPVATTWSLSFAKVEAANPTAAELLRICAFLAPDAIPEELLVEALSRPLPTSEEAEAKGEEGAGFSPITFGHLDKAVALLRTYSLVQRNGREQTLSVHRLVQTVVRDAIEEQTAWMTRVIGVMSALFPAVSFSTWERCARYLPQALMCATWMIQENLLSVEGASMLNQAGQYLNDRGQYREAEPLFVRALASREQLLGAEHLDTALSLNNLATLYDAQGKYGKAELLLRRALAIYEKVLGVGHPDTAVSLNNLAGACRMQGKYREAEPLYTRALAIREQELGTSHSDMALSLNNLAELYQVQGKYVEAEPLFVRALAINEQALEANHPHMAGSLNNLALLYKTQKKYREAEPLYARALAIREQELGTNHPDTATCLNNLAELYRAQGKYVEAEQLFVRALAINEQALGASHPKTASSLNNLALLYNTQGKYREAAPLYRRALTVFENIMGRSHPSTQTVRGNYATLLRTVGRDEEAERLEEEPG
jgi:tetratricopeptide (TPR) repeat protein